MCNCERRFEALASRSLGGTLGSFETASMKVETPRARILAAMDSPHSTLATSPYGSCSFSTASSATRSATTLPMNEMRGVPLLMASMALWWLSTFQTESCFGPRAALNSFHKSRCAFGNQPRMMCAKPRTTYLLPEIETPWSAPRTFIVWINSIKAVVSALLTVCFPTTPPAHA